MSEQMEKLMEEIRIEHWCKYCDRSWEVYPGNPLGNCEEDSKKDCNERVKQAIARIGKAFRDGNLDEALGVVGRGVLEHHGVHADFFFTSGSHAKELCGSYEYPFIAFRQGEEK